MNSQKSFSVSLLFVVAALLTSSTSAYTQPRYTAIAIGSLGGLTQATALNDVGQVVGMAYLQGSQHAFLYSGGTLQDLGANGLAEDINNRGQVVGILNQTAFIYENGSMHSLGTLGGVSSWARGINDHGDVVGTSLAANNGGGPAFLYSAGTMRSLGTLGGFSACGFAINNSGQIAGGSDAGPGIHRPFRYSEGVMSDLGSFGGPQGSGYAINDLGHVAGWAARDIWGSAFLYKDGIMHNLGTLGGSGSEAFGLNNNDQVVGVSYTAGGTEHAFIYHAGSLYDLNNLLATSLPTTLWKATDINESGQIVAWGEDSRSYLLTPIPEPTSIALVLLGIAATLVRRKTRT